ncbi:MAG: hypothetical protein JWQ98_3494 [Chlorobi bacterium]|nr:hypothetical protein [Chlorobiota bacterium]
MKSLLPICLLLVTAHSMTSAQKYGKIHDLSNIIKIMESSTVHFDLELGKINSIKAIAVEYLYPQVRETIAYPNVVKGDDGNDIEPRRFIPEAMKLHMNGEKALQWNDSMTAISLYAQAMKADPGCHMALVGIGEYYRNRKNYDRALDCFDRAITLNPFDYQTHVHRADVLLDPGRFDDARESLIQVLVLNPRHAPTMRMLHANSGRLKANPRDSLFAPAVMVHVLGNGDVTILLPQQKKGAQPLERLRVRQVDMGGRLHLPQGDDRQRGSRLVHAGGAGEPGCAADQLRDAGGE